MRMPRISLSLNPIQGKALRKLSKKIGSPIAEIVRRAIDAYLKRVKK